MNAKESTYWEERRRELKNKEPKVFELVLREVQERGPISSLELKDLDLGHTGKTGWSSSSVANSALDVLWHKGMLSIAHRSSNRKYFDLTERVVPEDILNERPATWKQFEKKAFLRRVHNVGLLPRVGDQLIWQLASYAKKSGLADKLVKNDEVALVKIDGIKVPCFAPPNAEEMLESAKNSPVSRRARFIAPLDPLIWARKFVEELWDFNYRWEVYVPPKKRQWGYYVLPVLYKNRFVGRFDGKFDKKKKILYVPNYYQEPGGLDLEHSAIQNAFERFQKYLGAEKIRFKKPPKT